jgi:hypothetical protein
MDDAQAVQRAKEAAASIKASAAASADPNDLSIYNLDTYDEDSKGSAMGAFSNVRWVCSVVSRWDTCRLTEVFNSTKTIPKIRTLL